VMDCKLVLLLVCVYKLDLYLIKQCALELHVVAKRQYSFVQGDQKISVHVKITIQKVTSNV
jgi:hypothetical protein